MRINIHTNNIALSSSQKSFITDKVQKLAHFADRLSDDSSEFKVDISYENSKKPEDSYICNLTFFVPSDVLRAESKSESLKYAVDEVIEKIKVQIERYKVKTHHINERKR